MILFFFPVTSLFHRTKPASPFLLSFFFFFLICFKLCNNLASTLKWKNKKKEGDYKGKPKTRDGKPKVSSLVRSHDFLMLKKT